MIENEYPVRVKSLLDSLQIPQGTVVARALPLQPEAEELVVVEVGKNGREHKLIPPAARAWFAMRTAASADGISLKIVSAFRGVDRQAEIVRDKLALGLSLEEILAVSAPPGYSEHHTGRAVDVTTEGASALELEFENTPAYQWLLKRANSFSYFLSFPRDNPYGYAFEPWHWCFRPAAIA
jgi:zinc D-Ala-D-Ala carboxypeptidase